MASKKTGVVLAGLAFALAAGTGASMMGFAGQPAPVETATAAAVPAGVPEVDPNTDITVYKSPTCGCCSAWIEHLEEHGFEVTTHDVSDVSQIKQANGITRELASCHTAIIDGYAIEGHVPAEDIRRLLEERPAVVGLTVPGMPMGSPGMEGPRSDPYDVLAYDRDGQTSVFASH